MQNAECKVQNDFAQKRHAFCKAWRFHDVVEDVALDAPLEMS